MSEVTVWVEYNMSEVPSWLNVKGKRTGKMAIVAHIDKMIKGALEDIGLEWQATGHASRISSSVFKGDLEKILNAPTEQEINAELARFDYEETDMVMVV